jgi:hypothetical protein
MYAGNMSNKSGRGWLVPISRCFMAKYFKVVLAVASFWNLFNQNCSTSFLKK